MLFRIYFFVNSVGVVTIGSQVIAYSTTGQDDKSPLSLSPQNICGKAVHVIILYMAFQNDFNAILCRLLSIPLPSTHAISSPLLASQ